MSTQSIGKAAKDATKEVFLATANIVGQTAKTANTTYENVTNTATNLTTATKNLSEVAEAGTESASHVANSISNVTNSVSSITTLLKNFFIRRVNVSENKNIQMQNKTEDQKLREANEFAAKKVELKEEQLKLEANADALKDPTIKKEYTKLAKQSRDIVLAAEQQQSVLDIAEQKRIEQTNMTQSNLKDSKVIAQTNQGEINSKYLQIGFYNNEYINLVIPRYWLRPTIISFKIIDFIQINENGTEVNVKVSVIKEEKYKYKFIYNNVTYNFGYEQLSVLAGTDDIFNTHIEGITNETENTNVDFTIQSLKHGGQYKRIVPVTKRFWRRGGKKTKKQRRKLKRKTKRRKNTH
jgi:hypothetical protein